MASPEKRAAILAAARNEFGSAGYRDTTMDSIALRAQVSKRTLYNHFATKEDMFLAVIRDFVQTITRLFAIRYSPEKSLREQLESRARASIALARDEENVQLFRAILAEHIRNPTLVAPAFASTWESEYGFVHWVEAAHRDGRLTVEDPTRAAHIFSSLMRGLITWPVLLSRVEYTSDKLPLTVTEAIDMFLAQCSKERPGKK
jgi:TetR/AcrR family transcriptional regulator of autoinduction and epiphytic fitness